MHYPQHDLTPRLTHQGLEAKKISSPSGRGRNFFLDIPSPETYFKTCGATVICRPSLAAFFLKNWICCWRYRLLVVLSPFVDVLLTVLQHSIDQSGEAVSHGGDGLRGTELGAQTAVLRAEVGAAADQGVAAIRSAVAARLTTRRVPLPSTLSPLMRLSGHSPNQEAKWASVFHRPMSSPTSLRSVWATITSMPSMRVRSTPVMRCSSLLRSNCGAFLVGFVFFSLRLLLRRGGGIVSAKLARCFCNCWSHSAIRRW